MDKKKVFVIMPFKDEFFEVYEMIKIKFADSFEFSNAGDEANLQPNTVKLIEILWCRNSLHQSIQYFRSKQNPIFIKRKIFLQFSEI